MCEACEEMDMYSLYLTKQEQELTPRPWFCQVIPAAPVEIAPVVASASPFTCDEPAGG